MKMEEDELGGELPPVAIPEHQLLRPIGKGSYGTVWLARNSFGVYRAVKIVFRDTFSDRRPFDRELSGIRKFEPISRSHEGFIDVLHVGINEAEEYFYYVMELGDDEASGADINPEKYEPKTLKREMVQKGDYTFDDCLQLGLALSLALGELHKHGLVHRDVKPSNILFVNGVPKLADIGLVAEAGEGRTYVGTEGFIPPEGPGLPPADVYGLGKVLYELSTGRDRNDFPELPTLLGNSPDRAKLLELNEVILHACDNRVEKRYASALDMHAHLLVLANGQSVKRLRLLERRFAALKRVASVSMAVSLLAAIAIIFAYREWKNAIETRQREVGADIANGTQAIRSGDLAGALPYLVEALRLDNRDSRRAETDRLRIASVIEHLPKLTQLWRCEKELRDVEFSPDGSNILVSTLFAQPRIYDVKTGEMVGQPFGPNGDVEAASFSPDGALIVVAGPGNKVTIWNAKNLTLVREFPLPGKAMHARFSPDAKRIVTASRDGSLIVWNAAERTKEFTRKQSGSPLHSCAFSHNGNLVVSTSEDKTACIWDLSGNLLHSLEGHGSWVYAAAFSPDDRFVITASADHTARVWDVKSGQQIRPVLEHEDLVVKAEFSLDGLKILTTCANGETGLWHADSLAPVLPAHILRNGAHLTHASFSPDGRCIVTGSNDGMVRLWDFARPDATFSPGKCIVSTDGNRVLRRREGQLEISNTVGTNISRVIATIDPEIKAINFAARNKLVVITSQKARDDGRINSVLRALDADSGEERVRKSYSASIKQYAFSDDSTYLAVLCGGAVQVGDSKGSIHDQTIPFTRPVQSLVFSPNGQQLLIVSGNEVHAKDTSTGKELFKPLKHSLSVNMATYNSKGTLFATCCKDDLLTPGYAQVWDAATGSPVGGRLQHNDGVRSVSFSPDAKQIVTGGEDHKSIIWDVASSRQIIPGTLHTETVNAAVFSQSAEWIVDASEDRSVAIWDATSGAQVTLPWRQSEQMSRTGFLPDGKHVYGVDFSTNVFVWRLPEEKRPVEELIRISKLLAGGTVTPSGGISAFQSEPQQPLWQELRAAYPSDFGVTEADVRAWHRAQVEDALSAGMSGTAIFHIEILKKLQPSDPWLVEAMERASAGIPDKH